MKIKSYLIAILLAGGMSQAFSQSTMKSMDEGVISNPDGSFTVIAPQMLRGHKSLPIHFESSKGACAILGFDGVLSAPIKRSDEPANSVSLSINGNYVTTEQDYFLNEVTCIGDVEYVKVGKADEIIENLDGSVSFINPKVVIGNSVYDIDGSGFGGGSGTCSLFGYENYLYGSKEIQHSSEPTVALKADGTYGYEGSSTKISAISCFSGQVKNIGAAGSKVYYHKANSSLSSLHEKGISTYQLD